MATSGRDGRGGRGKQLTNLYLENGRRKFFQIWFTYLAYQYTKFVKKKEWVLLVKWAWHLPYNYKKDELQ